ncbi:hypothetical protein [Microbacterium sp. NPDC058389]|uniref:hypothetical protein n=1 Tax=Microbacterium sp. NPDC058389 TaxID=3346475 RepID=UPI0036494B58
MNGQQTRHGNRTAAATGVAARLVLAWVDCYTDGVSAQTAERRRDEIHSDLWEQQADAHETGRPRLAVSLSIARRAVAGVPADLLWVHTQRAASRGLPAEQKARSMNNAFRLVDRWWWVLGAAVLAAWGFAMGIGQLLEPGMPYVEGSVQAITLSALLAAGVVLRARMPRTAGALVVAGATTFAALWWMPVAMVIAVAVVIGAAVSVVRAVPRHDPLLSVLTVAGLAAVGAAPLCYVAMGYGSGALGLMWFVLAAVGTALLIAVGTPRGSAVRPA